MHVLVIPSWFYRYLDDPSGSFFETQASGVQELGVQVGIIYPDIRPLYEAAGHWCTSIESTSRNGVDTLRKRYVNWTPRIESLILPRWVSVGLRLFDEYCRRYGKPDIIHAHCLLRAGILAHRIWQKYGIPYVITEHSSKWHNNEISKYDLQISKSAAQHSSALISVSESLLNKLHKYLDFNQAYIIGNAVDSLFLDEKVQEFNNASRLTFANVAYLNSGKRQDILIEAFYLAFGQDTEHVLYIVGEGPERASLERRIAEYDMQSSIQLLGMQKKSEIAKLLSRSDCFVLTSDHETFGVAIIEALACGLPIISTDCGGPSEIVNAENGIVVMKGNAQAIMEALLEMQKKIHVGQYQKKRIRAGCREHYSKRSVASKLINIYKNALHK
ncbi:glycosyltransferase [Stutzerimonas nitrititolerans]|uniref:glycosyltransferase n=1 Tax=Stutzerimonas nitrititolerans TaxID=2482751 RepID=UPI002898E9A8|nr:glycosyltransferase [Stutzerimonas nitrititolerans]